MTSSRKKQQEKVRLLLKHSHLLRCTTNLATSRFVQLGETAQAKGISIWSLHGDDLVAVQEQTAKDIGGVKTKIKEDAAVEIEQYHFGPTEISYCLFSAMLEHYCKLRKEWPQLVDRRIEKYCVNNQKFVTVLKELRDAILHAFEDKQAKAMEALAEADLGGRKAMELIEEGHGLLDAFLVRNYGVDDFEG